MSASLFVYPHLSAHTTTARSLGLGDTWELSKGGFPYSPLMGGTGLGSQASYLGLKVNSQTIRHRLGQPARREDDTLGPHTPSAINNLRAVKPPIETV